MARFLSEQYSANAKHNETRDGDCDDRSDHHDSANHGRRFDYCSPSSDLFNK